MPSRIYGGKIAQVREGQRVRGAGEHGMCRGKMSNVEQHGARFKEIAASAKTTCDRNGGIGF